MDTATAAMMSGACFKRQMQRNAEIVAAGRKGRPHDGFKEFASGLRGLTNDDDFRWDDGDLGWGVAGHQGDLGGHDDHSPFTRI